MEQTRIFVSSTCYDLKEVREEISNFIHSLGHLAFLSENRSFPVMPEMSGIDNCKRNVRENTDLFLLIVGGRYGSTDPETEKSITNVEYDTAIDCGLDVFVFVDKQILNALSIWKKNPNADFSSHVDSIDIFRFIEQVNSKHWVHGFDKIADIKEALQNQLSFYFRTLLQKYRIDRPIGSGPFALSPESIRRIVSEKHGNWEYILLVELMGYKMEPILKELEAIRTGKRLIGARGMALRDYFDWATARPQTLLNVAAGVKERLKDLTTACGEVGVSGNEFHILETVDWITHICQTSLEWEIEQRSVHPPDEIARPHEISLVWGGNIIKDVEKFVNDFRVLLDQKDLDGHHQIVLTLEEPAGIDEYCSEIDRLSEQLPDWIDAL